ncbi:MAG: HEAT repeat domain-containing protein [Actinomycetota bacterium]|nr:HEAT repeat domain-containing protein [Actinomycetota bacterium]
MGIFSRKPRLQGPEAVHAHLQTMREQVEVNEREGRGLLNMPRYGEAVAALRTMGQTAVPTLVEVLPREVDMAVEKAPNIASEIVEILGKSGDPTVVDLLVSVMDGTRFPEYPGATWGAMALGHMGTHEAQAALAAALSDSELREYAAKGCMFLAEPRPEVVDQLLEAATDEAYWKANAAIHTLAKLRVARARPVLDELAANAHNDRVRSAAERALVEVR